MMRHLAAAWVIGLLACDMACAVTQGTIDVVVRNGFLGPGGVERYDTFSAPVLNNAGQLAFSATLTNTPGGAGVDDLGIYRTGVGAIDEIALKGDAPPGGNGTFNTLGSISLNDTGQVGFTSLIANSVDPPNDSDGVFRGNGTVIDQIVRAGSAPSDSNGSFATFFDGAVINSAGQLGFQAFIGGTLNSPFDDSGLFVGNGGTPTQVVREGGAAPGSIGTFDGNFVTSPSINNAGQAAFGVTLAGTAGAPNDNEFIYRGNGGPLVTIAREGTAHPDGDGTFGVLGGSGTVFGAPVLNESGVAAFTAQLIGTSGGNNDNSGIFSGNGTTTTTLAREGDTSPDGNGEFSFFNPPAFNDMGQAAFIASLRNTSGQFFDNRGVFRSDGNNTVLAFRKGLAAPSDVAFDGTFDSFGAVALNNAGQVLVEANLANTSDGALNDRGLFLFDDARGVVPIVREGDIINGQAVTSIALAAGAAEDANDPERNGLNDAGQVAFLFVLADGDRGLALFSFFTGDGDYNDDGVVNAADYVVWRDTLGQSVPTGTGADGNGNGVIDQGDFLQWRATFGSSPASGLSTSAPTVPEPCGLSLLLAGAALLTSKRRSK